MLKLKRRKLICSALDVRAVENKGKLDNDHELLNFIPLTPFHSVGTIPKIYAKLLSHSVIYTSLFQKNF